MSELGPSQLLAAWRTAERRLSSRDPDAVDFEDLSQEAERLRSECIGPNAGDGAPFERRHLLAVDPEGSAFG